MYFLLPDGGISLKLKHVARNKSDINVSVLDGVYVPLLLFVDHSRMSLIKVTSLI
jgi:hypothetical protein